MTNQQLVLENMQAPGDVLMFTCAVRDLHKQYPKQFITTIASSAPDIWINNPQNRNGDRNLPTEHIKVGYSSAIHQSNFRSAHFSSGFCQELSEKTGTRIQLTDMRPDIYFSNAELDPASAPVKGKYWVAIAGGKTDFTAKVWDFANWRALTRDLLKDTQIVQAGAAGHTHQPIEGAINLIGKTSFREFMLLIKHSQGVICPITCAMHLAAACNKSCVVIAGGREGWWWEAYTKKTWAVNVPNRPVPADFVEHAYLHTIDKLECCTRTGCWRNAKGEQTHAKNCKTLVRGSTGMETQCLQMITPAMVAAAVRKYMAGEPPVTDDIPTYLKPPLFTEPLPANHKPIYTAPPMSKPKEINVMLRRQRNGKIRRHMLPPNLRKSTQVTTTSVPVTSHILPLKPTVTTLSSPVLPVTTAPWTGPLKNMKSLTIAVLLYGNNLGLAQRCLRACYRSVSPKLFELRLGLNAVSPEVLIWINQEIVPYGNVKLFNSPENIFKYPMMRRMFTGMTSEFVTWFDDDSHAVDPMWLSKLDTFVGHNPDARMIGKRYFMHLKEGQVEWIKQAKWYKGKDVERRKGAAATYFATGGWWTARTDLMRQLDWPDPRLSNNGGDTNLGASCWQNDAKVYEHHEGIKISDAPRRGASQTHPGC